MFHYISFNIPNQYDNFLFKIIDNTKLSNQIMLFNNLDILGKDFSTNFNISNGYCCTLDDVSSIKNNNYYIIFLKLTFFHTNDCVSTEEILSLSDFLLSSSSAMMFITDSTMVNIIAKEYTVIDQLKNNAINNNFTNVKVGKNKLPINFFNYY